MQNAKSRKSIIIPISPSPNRIQPQSWAFRYASNYPRLFRISLLQAQHLPDIIPHLLLVVLPPLPPHLSGFDVGGTLVVGLGEHAHDADEDLLDGLDGGPALGGVLVVVWVVAGGVEDGNADEAARVD